MDKAWDRSFGEWLAHKVCDGIEVGLNFIASPLQPLADLGNTPCKSDAEFLAKGIGVGLVGVATIAATAKVSQVIGTLVPVSQTEPVAIAESVKKLAGVIPTLDGTFPLAPPDSLTFGSLPPVFEFHHWWFDHPKFFHKPGHIWKV